MEDADDGSSAARRTTAGMAQLYCSKAPTSMKVLDGADGVGFAEDAGSEYFSSNAKWDRQN